MGSFSSSQKKNVISVMKKPENLQEIKERPPKIDTLQQNIPDEDKTSKALKLISSLQAILYNFRKKTQTSKVFLKRMQTLGLKLTELKNSNFSFEDLCLDDLLNILEKFKEFGEQLTNSLKSIFDEMKNYILSNSEQIKFIKLNELLSKSLSNLRIPFSVEETENDQKLIRNLQILSGKIAETLRNIQGNGIFVLGINWRCLFNEEAFLFWVECFPDRHFVPLEEFKANFHGYFEGYKEIDLRDEEIEILVKLIVGEENAGFVNAKELNVFFENTPIDVEWDKIEVLKEKIKETKEERKKDFVEIERKKLKKEINNDSVEGVEEKKYAKENQTAVKIPIEKLSIEKKGEEKEIKGGNIYFLGKIVRIFWNIDNEFSLSGIMDSSGSFNLTESTKTKDKSMDFNGNIIKNGKKLCLLGNSYDSKLKITINLQFWEGYCLQNDTINENEAFFNFFDNKLIGLSIDENRVAIWNGIIYESEINLIKKYIDGVEESNIEGKLIRTDFGFEIIGDLTSNEVKIENGFFMSSNEEDNF